MRLPLFVLEKKNIYSSESFLSYSYSTRSSTALEKKTPSSKYKGVSLDSKKGMFEAYVRTNKKYSLGKFSK